MGKQWKLWETFGDSKITADGDCSHGIKRCLLLGRKVMTNLDSIKKQRHYIDNIGPSSQSYGFSSSHVWIWELDYKESWVPKNWCFWTVVLEKILESPSNCKDIQPVRPKRNQSWIYIGRTDAEAEAPILWPPDAKNWLTGKDLDSGKDWRQEEKGTTGDEMTGWHHWLDGHEFKQGPGIGDGQGSLACCSPWGSQSIRHDWATEWNSSAIKRSLLPIHTITWMNLKNIMLGKRSQSQKLTNGKTQLILNTPNQQIHWDRKHISDFEVLGIQVLGSDCLMDMDFPFGAIKIFWI